MATISDNLQVVGERIARAARAAGRDPVSVTLLAVSKSQPVARIEEARTAGHKAFGENYVQEALEKMDALPGLEWHLIGPLQSNKTRLVATHFDWAHTVDRLKTAQRLSEQRPAGAPPLQVCIQVNIDGGPTKAGVAPHEVLPLAREMVMAADSAAEIDLVPMADGGEGTVEALVAAHRLHAPGDADLRDAPSGSPRRAG